jgi:hypothetical protein
MGAQRRWRTRSEGPELRVAICLLSTPSRWCLWMRGGGSRVYPGSMSQWQGRVGLSSPIGWAKPKSQGASDL